MENNAVFDKYRVITLMCCKELLTAKNRPDINNFVSKHNVELLKTYIFIKPYIIF